MRTGLMATVVGLAGSLAMGSGVSATSDNAALEYYRAWSMLGDSREQVIDTGGDEIVLSDGAEDLLNNMEDSIKILISASAIHDADWGVDFEAGPNTLVTHLGSLRHSARLMTAAALMHAEAGELDRASACVAALHRIGVHSASGDTLIGSLVGIAIGNLGVELTDQMIDDGMIKRDGAREILDAIHMDDTVDRYRMRDAIFGEWRMMSEYIVKHAPEKNAGAWLIKETMIGDQSEPEKKIQRMDRSQLMRELGGFAEYHADLLSAWDAQSASKLERAEKKVQSGAYGTLTQVMGATLLRSFTSHQTSSKQLDQLIERLEEIAD